MEKNAKFYYLTSIHTDRDILVVFNVFPTWSFYDKQNE